MVNDGQYFAIEAATAFTLDAITAVPMNSTTIVIVIPLTIEGI